MASKLLGKRGRNVYEGVDADVAAAASILESLSQADVDAIKAWSDTVITDPDASSQVDDALDELVDSSMGGRRHLKRGGAKTTQALKKVVSDVIVASEEASESLDTAAASAVYALPALAKGLASGTVVTLAVKNPGFLAATVKVVNSAVKGFMGSQITWGEILYGIRTVVPEIGSSVATAGQFATTPAGVFLIASLIARYRASSKGMSVVDMLKEDANAVKTGVTTKANDIITYVEAQKAAAEKKIRKDRFDELRKKLEESLKPVVAAPAADAAMPAMGGPGPAATDAMATGGRRYRKKTKKRAMKKKRMTRRRLTFSY